ncbi:MAG TPA: hypothetical protein VI759_05985 [Dehalococcoidia bacterium]|nr:hypothetical protein [Dehalococcoidia bacterium]
MSDVAPGIDIDALVGDVMLVQHVLARVQLVPPGDELVARAGERCRVVDLRVRPEHGLEYLHVVPVDAAHVAPEAIADRQPVEQVLQLRLRVASYFACHSFLPDACRI